MPFGLPSTAEARWPCKRKPYEIQGKRFQLAIAGQIIGIHPIEKGISNGVLPFLLSESITQENAYLLLQELNLSLYHIRGELEQNK